MAQYLLILNLASVSTLPWAVSDERPILSGQATSGTTVDVDFHGDTLPARATVRLGTVRYRHPGWFKHVEFLPGQHNFVVSTKDSSPKVWNSLTGKLIREISHSDRVSRFKVHRPTGDVAMLTTDINNRTRICRTRFFIRKEQGGKLLTWQEPFTEQSTRFAISPDGKTLVTGTYHGELKFRDLASGEQTHVESVVNGAVQSIDWSPNGDFIAAAGRRKVIIWKWQSDERPIRLEGLPRGAQIVKFSHDGRYLAVGSSWRAAATLWDVQTAKMIREFNKGSESYYHEGICFSAGDDLLFVPHSKKKTVETYDVETGELKRSYDAGVVETRSVSISDDGRFLAAVGSSVQIAVWDLNSGERISDRFHGHADVADVISFTSDGRQVVSGSREGSVRIWDSHTGRQIREVHHDRWVSGLTVAKDADQFLTFGLDNSLRVWHTVTGDEVHRSSGHGTTGGPGSTAIGYTEDGREYLSFGSDFFLQRRNAETGELIQRLPIRPTVLKLEDNPDGTPKIPDHVWERNVVSGARFDAEGKRLLLCVAGGLYVYNTQTGKEIDKYEPGQKLSRFVLSPDGQVLITVTQVPNPDRNPRESTVYVLQICDFTQKRVKHEFVPDGFPYALCFSDDGRFVAIGRNKGSGAKVFSSISIFEVATEEVNVRIPVGRRPIRQVSFSPDGRRIVSSHADTSILIWNLANFRQPAVAD